MVASFLNVLGVTSTPIIEAVCVALLGSFMLALTYKLLDFFISLVTSLIGRDDKISM